MIHWVRDIQTRDLNNSLRGLIEFVTFKWLVDFVTFRWLSSRSWYSEDWNCVDVLCGTWLIKCFWLSDTHWMSHVPYTTNIEWVMSHVRHHEWWAWRIHMCDMTHSHATHRHKHNAITCNMSSLIYMRDVTYFHVIASLMHMCDMTHFHATHRPVQQNVFSCDMSSLVYMCNMTYSHVIASLMNMCDMTHSQVTHWHVRHHVFSCDMSSLMYMCATWRRLTREYVMLYVTWHDSFDVLRENEPCHVQWVVCDMTHSTSYVRMSHVMYNLTLCLCCRTSHVTYNQTLTWQRLTWEWVMSRMSHVTYKTTSCMSHVTYNQTFSWRRLTREWPTPEILQIQNLKFLGTNSNWTKISIWICTARNQEFWVSRLGGFRGCSIFCGNSHKVYFMRGIWSLVTNSISHLSVTNWISHLNVTNSMSHQNHLNDTHVAYEPSFTFTAAA